MFVIISILILIVMAAIPVFCVIGAAKIEEKMYNNDRFKN